GVPTALRRRWVGGVGKAGGRGPLLLMGFGVRPTGGLVFALTAEPPLLISVQLLDGISGAVIGVLTVLVIADLTRGSGHFNLAQGLIGTASGIGAALSTALFGLMAMSFGRTAAFLSVASVGLLSAATLF